MMIDVNELIKGTGIQLQAGDEIIYECIDNLVTIIDNDSGEILFIDELH